MRNPIIKLIVQYFIGIIICFLVIEGLKSIFPVIDGLFDPNNFNALIAILIGTLTIVCTIYVACHGSPQTPFNSALKSFFENWIVKILFVIMLAVFLQFLLLEKTDSGGQPDSGEQPVNGGQPDTTGNNIQLNDKKQTDEPFIKQPYLSLTDWEKDPFLLGIDNYCGYHVEGSDLAEVVFFLLEDCQKNIKVRGVYPHKSLNGTDSLYAGHTRRANELYKGYQLFAEQKILNDYQITLLEDTIKERKLADELFQVSDNQMIIGDSFLSLGNIFKEEDIGKAFECYQSAFSIFQSAYRTSIAEGESQTRLTDLAQRIQNSSDKLSMLTGMDSPVQTMAPIIASAYNRLAGSAQP